MDERATQLHAIASLKVLLDATKPQNGRVETYRSEGLTAEARPDAQSHVSGRSSQGTEVTQVDSVVSSDVTSNQGGPQTNGDVSGDAFPNNVSYTTRAIRRISYKAAQSNDNMLTVPEDPEMLTPGVSTVRQGGRDIRTPVEGGTRPLTPSSLFLTPICIVIFFSFDDKPNLLRPQLTAWRYTFLSL